MMRPNQLDADRACVLVIDVQEKFLPLIRNHDDIVSALRKILATARIFELPVIVTEQNPPGVGHTIDGLSSELKDARASVIEKSTFSAWAEPSFREAILNLDRPQVILTGIETHVCIQQTALDMLSRDYDVFVCADAVGSRGPTDHEHALSRMRQEGAWVTTVESVMFELCGRWDAPRFKPMLEVIKRSPPASG